MEDLSINDSNDTIVTSCPSCQSKWKPTRRGLVKAAAAVVAAIAISGSLDAVGTPAQAAVVNTVDCELQLAADTASCHAAIPEPSNPVDEMLLDACLAAAAFDYGVCKAAQAAETVVEALAAAAQWVIDHAVEIGTVIVIGGIVILVVACVVATDGVCLVVAGPVLATV